MCFDILKEKDFEKAMDEYINHFMMKSFFDEIGLDEQVTDVEFKKWIDVNKVELTKEIKIEFDNYVLSNINRLNKKINIFNSNFDDEKINNVEYEEVILQ